MPAHRSLRRLAVAGVAALGLLGACAGDSQESTTSATTKAEPKATAADKVTVKDFVFSPKAVTVTAGSTVTWTNEDDFDHSIVIDDLDLDGPKFGPETMPLAYSHRFETAGTYPYICGVHNSMTGTVVVT